MNEWIGVGINLAAIPIGALMGKGIATLLANHLGKREMRKQRGFFGTLRPGSDGDEISAPPWRQSVAYWDRPKHWVCIYGWPDDEDQLRVFVIRARPGLHQHRALDYVEEV